MKFLFDVLLKLVVIWAVYMDCMYEIGPCIWVECDVEWAEKGNKNWWRIWAA